MTTVRNPPSRSQIVLDLFLIRRYNSKTGFYDYSTGSMEPKWKSLKSGKIWRNMGHIKNHVNMFKESHVKIPESYKNAHDIEVVKIEVDVLSQMETRVEKVCTLYDLIIEN